MRKTQTDELINFLQDHKEISSWEAFERFGITRLSGLIYEIKRKGYVIKTDNRLVQNRYGASRYIAFYSIAKAPKDAAK